MADLTSLFDKYWAVITRDPTLARITMDAIEASSGKEIARRVREPSHYLTEFTDGTRLDWYRDIFQVHGRRIGKLWCDTSVYFPGEPIKEEFAYAVLSSYYGDRENIHWI